MLKTASRLLFLTVIFSMFSLSEIHAQEGAIVVNQDSDIDTLLRLKKDVNRTAMNYKIQIYNGNRAGAEKARLEFRNSFSDWITSMRYETPNYKIWVGNFKTRLEADRALQKIKKKFSNAFRFKPKKEKKIS